MSIEIVSAQDDPRGHKPPRQIFPRLFAFPPNRDTLGGTAYLIIDTGGNVLVDCPPPDESTKVFLEQYGVAKIFLTHRGCHGQTLPQLQKVLGCEVIVQEQESYLLPSIESRTFETEVDIYPHCQGFWTCGHSPGSSCLYWHDRELGGILFSGRHLLPNQQGQPVPLRTSKTFHWPRQLKNVKLIIDRFSADTLQYICPGANTGFLRGKHWIESPYPSLISLDLVALGESVPII